MADLAVGTPLDAYLAQVVQADARLKDTAAVVAAVAEAAIGISAVTGKHPAEIAVSVAGELISVYQGTFVESGADKCSPSRAVMPDAHLVSTAS